jgi:hypothetical protein
MAVRGFVKYNRILGKEASVGPIPAAHLLPWTVLVGAAWIVSNVVLDLGIGWFLGVSVWWVASWTILAQNKPYRFIDGWRSPPGKDWCNGHKRYISPLFRYRTPEQQQQYGDAPVRIKLKPQLILNHRAKRERYMPFQNELHLCCMAEISKNDREVAAYLLELGNDRYQFVFAFEFDGLHNNLSDDEVNNQADALSEGLKYLLPGEQLTFFAGCYSEDVDRQKQLEQLADTTTLTPISVILRNEQVRVRQLTEKGSRRTWKQLIFCTWTSNAEGTTNQSDWIASSLRWANKAFSSLIGTVTGNKALYEEQFYARLFLNAFQDGFQQWEMLLSTKLGLSIRPCTSQGMWDWLWHRFNDKPAPEIPQVIRVEERETGYQLSERRTTNKHAVTILIEGYNGESTVPLHQEAKHLVVLPGRRGRTHCATLTFEEPPMGWPSTREQLRWIWKSFSSTLVRDTEIFVELGTVNNFIIQDNLARQAKAGKSAQIVAAQKGQGRDIGAEIKQEESFEAQRRLYEGVRAVKCAPVILVYRASEEELEVACTTLSNQFDTAQVIRDRQRCWHLWLQTFPVTHHRILHGTDIMDLSDRRLTPDTTTVAGFLPLTLPKAIDKQGVEFVTDQGGRPLHIDVFAEGAKRILVCGSSGSGKSVMAWRFAVDALARNIPVIGMDISSGKGSTFKVAIEALGDQGAYIDIKSCSSNLMEPPDLRHFSKKERSRRMDSWKDSTLGSLMAICIGKINMPHLSQRVEALLRIALDIFLRDADIIERYNRALERGWQSEEWQQMPTLRDFKRYCTRERLNLTNYEEIDKQALNQIVNQIEALLVSPLGKMLGNPSSYNPEPAIKFFALSGLSSEQDSYLMAIAAHTACIRTALSHPRSLFIGDELSVLLKKDGFAFMVGELCATGRKDGIAIVLIGQDPDSFYECAAGAQILQNMNYRLTGRITSAAALAFTRLMSYPPMMIAGNATESFLPRISDLFSYWLIEKDGVFWKTRFYPGEIMLACVANSQDEQAARARTLAQYPDTVVGRLQGLAAFTRLYVAALKENRSIAQIGIDENAVSQPTALASARR